MKMAIAGAALFLSANVASAQQIEWKQVQNTPKGLNLPQSIELDILGIGLGESFDEVKPKFERLLAEVQKPAPAKAPKPKHMLSDVELDMAVRADSDRMMSNATAQATAAPAPRRFGKGKRSSTCPFRAAVSRPNTSAR